MGPSWYLVDYISCVLCQIFDLSGSEIKSKKKYHIDTVSLNYPKKDMDVETYMKDGMIDNWDIFEKVILKGMSVTC